MSGPLAAITGQLQAVGQQLQRVARTLDDAATQAIRSRRHRDRVAGVANA